MWHSSSDWGIGRRQWTSATLTSTLPSTQNHAVISASARRNVVLNLLQTLGFIINWEKSSLEPSQDFVFLGLIWNAISGHTCLPLKQLSALQCLATAMVPSSPTCLSLQILLGHMTSSIPAVPLIRLRARPLQWDLASVYKSARDSKVQVKLTADSVGFYPWSFSDVKPHCPLLATNGFRLAPLHSSSATSRTVIPFRSFGLRLSRR